MNVISKYSNFFNEVIDTIEEKNKSLQEIKAQSVAFKALGAGLMFAGASFAIGAVAVLPLVGASLVLLTSGVALAILGYDFAEWGDCMRRHVDSPFSEAVKGGFKVVENMWSMGIEKGFRNAQFGYFAQNTLVISKITKLIASVISSEKK